MKCGKDMFAIMTDMVIHGGIELMDIVRHLASIFIRVASQVILVYVIMGMADGLVMDIIGIKKGIWEVAIVMDAINLIVHGEVAILNIGFPVTCLMMAIGIILLTSMQIILIIKRLEFQVSFPMALL